LTGKEVRALAAMLQPILQNYSVGGMAAFPNISTLRKPISKEQSLYMQKSPQEFQIGRFFEEYQEIYQKSLQSEKCMEAAESLGYSDLANYFIQDQSFIRM
jgi:hypothetical protein